MMERIYEIIARELSGEYITPEERAQLDVWLAHTEENLKIHALLKRVYTSGRDIRNNEEEGHREAYRAVLTGIGKKIEKRKFYRLFYLAGAAVVTLLLSVALSVLLSDKEYTIELLSQEQQIVPGSPKAQLKLNNGQIISLPAENHVVIIADNLLEITSENNTLIYSETGQNAVVEQLEYNTLTIPSGAEYTLVLSDSSRVFLNSGSELRYPVIFGKERRDVFLKGEAYFDVKKDTGRLFTVNTNSMNISVLGTSFNVSAYEAKSTMATLVSGKIRVSCANEVYHITPGEQFFYDKKNQKSEIREVDTELYTSWKDGYYKFNKATLEEIMSTLSLWYDLDVFYLNDAVKNIKFTGRLKRYDDAWELLNKIEETGSIGFKVRGKCITIISK